MTLFLTGSPTRFGEDHFTQDNGFLSELLSVLPSHPVTLLVSASPDDAQYNKSVYDGMSLCISRSGIECAKVTMLDRSNVCDAASLVGESDWVILCGGHVPTQNAFLNEIGLKALLEDFDGVVLGCSAGSMNCAGLVYSHPELEGESLDPHYSKWLNGLGITGMHDLNLIPHYDQVRYAVLDGKRLFEDIIFPDSHAHHFYTFPDGGYIVCRNGRAQLRGTAWEISDGSMKQISAENNSYTFMNVIFISPHFPETYSQFCAGLRRNGVNVFGIADAPYESLCDELRNSLTEYYKVNNLEDYNEVFRAVAYFSFKYGKIDWIESNNEYWLEQDARLRTDFNVTTGLKSDRIAFIKNKSEMKKCYAAGGIPTARQIKASEGLDKVLSFAGETGWPLIAKPDNGVGADGTFKLCSQDELRSWFSDHSTNYGAFVIEEFITGDLVSYDAIIDSKGNPVFENNSVFPTPIMEIVNKNLDSCYYTNKDVPAALAEIGRRTVKAFGVVSRFVHLEFFRLDRDRKGLGKKGDYVGLEVNMRAPGGYTPDMMDYGHSTDVFQIWADMVAFDERRKDLGEQYYCAHASRRDCHRYVHTHEEIMSRYGSDICMHRRMPQALAGALGDVVYIARFKDKKDINPFFDFVTTRI